MQRIIETQSYINYSVALGPSAKKRRAGWKIVMSEGFRKRKSFKEKADKAEGRQLFSVFIICFAEYYDVRMHREHQIQLFHIWHLQVLLGYL